MVEQAASVRSDAVARSGRYVLLSFNIVLLVWKEINLYIGL
jgi:hypothetical protein